MSVFKQLRQRRLSQEEAQLDREIDSIQRIMEDEAFQNTFLDPEAARRVGSREGVDEVPDAIGEFGLDLRNPIPVNGALGAISYLSRLKTLAGERVLFQRVGGDEQVHAYEAVTYSGLDWYLFFLDINYPRKSKSLPKGFELTGDVAMFSGFSDTSSSFPEDFSARVSLLDVNLQAAFAPETRFGEYFGRQAYQRPLVHWAKLEALGLRGLL